MPSVVFENKTPQIGERCFIAPNAYVIGDVEIGADSSIWFGAVLRGDMHAIRIGDRVNIQDNSVVHVTSGRYPTTVEDDVTVGHMAIIHGCVVKKGALVGMGSIVMDGAVVGEGALVAAGSLVTEGAQIPSRMLAVGRPARPKRPLTDEEMAFLAATPGHYAEFARKYL